MKKFSKAIIFTFVLLSVMVSNIIHTNGDYKNKIKEEYMIVNDIKMLQGVVRKKKFKFKKIRLKKKYSGVNKSYMDLNCITSKGSKQYKMKKYYRNDNKGHYYMNYKKQKFYVVALGNYFGKVGDKFKVNLSNGNSFYAIKGDSKSDSDVNEKYAHKGDGSVIEFILDTNKAKRYYGSNNGYVCNGNLNNHSKWNGKITSVSKIVE